MRGDASSATSSKETMVALNDQRGEVAGMVVVDFCYKCGMKVLGDVCQGCQKTPSECTCVKPGDERMEQ